MSTIMTDNFACNNTTSSYVTDVINTSSEAQITSKTMTIIHSLIASVGIIGNMTVIVVFLNHKKYRKKIPNTFIINQSLLDFSASFTLLLITLTVRDTYSIVDNGTIGTMQCLLWNTKFILWGLFASSTWNIVSLTFERYLELVHTMWHKANFKVGWIYASFVVNWMFGLAFHAAYMIPTTKVVSGECLVYNFWPSPLVNSAFGVFLIFYLFVIPLIILIYCYGRILWVLTRRIGSNLETNGAQSETRANQSDKFQLARTNTIKTFLLVGICFIICWSQNQIYFLMYNFGYEIDWNASYYQFTVLMVFLNCTVNPFIYLFKYDDYQVALKKLLRCKKAESEKFQSSSSISAASTDSSHI